MTFADRAEGGRKLAEKLEEYGGPDTIVLGLPRGGVITAAEIARVLNAPLDVIITRKIGAPGNSEYAIGAIAENGQLLLNEEEVAALGAELFLQEEMERQQKEIERQKQVFRGGGGLPELKGKTVILADDGLATGHTMLAAVKAAVAEGAERVIVAVPVGPPDTIKKLKDVADDVVYITSPEHFFAVGHFYRDFRQVTDEQVKAKLEKPNVTKVL